MTEHFKECASAAVSRTLNEAINAQAVQDDNNNDTRMNVMLKDCKVNRSRASWLRSGIKVKCQIITTTKNAQGNSQSVYRRTQRCKQNKWASQIFKCPIAHLLIHCSYEGLSQSSCPNSPGTVSVVHADK